MKPEQLDMFELLTKEELEEAARQKAEQPYRNGLGMILPWEDMKGGE